MTASNVTPIGTLGATVYPAPTVGRIVNMFKADTTIPLAGIVTEAGLYDDLFKVTLTVFERSGPRVMHEVEFSPEPAAGKWSWPARS